MLQIRSCFSLRKNFTLRKQNKDQLNHFGTYGARYIAESRTNYAQIISFKKCKNNVLQIYGNVSQ